MNLIRRLLLAVCALAFAALPATAQVTSVNTTQVSVTPNTSAYTAGYCLGGVLTVPSVFRAQGSGSANLAAVTFLDPAGQTAANDAMELLVFNALPAGTYTDHAACAVAAADNGKFIGHLTIGSSNCYADATSPATTICTLVPTAPLPMTSGTLPVTNTAFYVVPIVTGTPTYGSVTLLFKFMTQPYFGN